MDLKQNNVSTIAKLTNKKESKFEQLQLKQVRRVSASAPLRDRPFNLQGGGQKKKILPRKIFFLHYLTLGYMTKTLNQTIFFPPPKSDYFF